MSHHTIERPSLSRGSAAGSAARPRERAGGGPALGTTYEEAFLPSQAEEETNRRYGTREVRALRYRLQRAVRALIPDARPARCHWQMTGESVSGRYAHTSGRASFKGLMCCGSVWGCPVCSAKISEGRRKLVAEALKYAEYLGLRAVPVTRTIRHSRGDKLEELLARFRAARSASIAGRAKADFWDEFGVEGHITALEVTHGDNGWHVHSHEVWFLRSDANLDEFEARLLSGWQKQVTKAGLQSVTVRGLQVDKHAFTSAEYLTKFGRHRSEEGWGVSHELAKSVCKGSRKGSRTPIELLEAFLSGDKQAGALWQEYYRVFENRRQLVWSKGLRALLLPETPYLPDEELATDEPEPAREVVKLLPVHWRCVLRADARAAVLAAIEAGEKEGGPGALVTVGALLERLGCEAPLVVASAPYVGEKKVDGPVPITGPAQVKCSSCEHYHVAGTRCNPAPVWAFRARGGG
jgi:hypothetical protein